MISKKITDTDAFLDMPLSTQALYFHFIQNADDDGFVGSPNSIMRKIGASKNDYDLLIVKRFIIVFDTGICVIKHWRIHNYIQNDRYTPTTYVKEKAQLAIGLNKAYTDKKFDCIENVYIADTQDSIGKDSIDKVRIEKGKEDKNNIIDNIEQQALENTPLNAPKGEIKSVEDLISRQNKRLQTPLKGYAKMCEEIGKPLDIRHLQEDIEELRILAHHSVPLAVEIIQQSIEHKMRAFYPLDDDNAWLLKEI